MLKNLLIYSILIGICIISCTSHEGQLFVLKESSGIEFNNELSYTNDLNPYTYRNYYNGAGVGVGDFNNDGLDDIYFTGNQVDNKLYKNIGGLKFEEVTFPLISCAGAWSTGVSVLDINGDGLLDIYVCKAGPPEGPRRTNELFINQGDFKFEEKAAEYGLDIKGFSIHASFFDFDNDGDLDCYLLNNSIRSVGGHDLRPGLRDISSDNGNMLLVNEAGRYVNKSDELGIYTSDIGFGLGVNTSDINGDGWKDIYVGNDFFEKDYLYINKKGKGFEERGEDFFASCSLGSMGVDVADINDDGLKDIFVAEMAPATIDRKKTKASYESWDKHQKAKRSGYHNQFGRNMMHLSQGTHFSDISRMKGLDATEWSWAPLIFDMDNDGLKDIFISNGVGKDLLDRDYLAYMANEQQVSELLENRNDESVKKLIDIMPSKKTMNAFFLQGEGLAFDDVSGLEVDIPASFSNATALSDFDLDGDLDMIISNINDEPFLLENKSANNYLSIELVTDSPKQITIGAELVVYSNDKVRYTENNPYRGFQSSNTQRLIVGLGQETRVDSISVIWPDGKLQTFANVAINQPVQLKRTEEGENSSSTEDALNGLKITELNRFEYEYPVRLFNEFNKEKLLPFMLPTKAPVVVSIPGSDGLNDEIVFGGSQNFQLKKGVAENGQLIVSDSTFFSKSFRPSVSAIQPFDSDNDGDLDLYVAHGSRVFSQYSSELDDILYINDGGGRYSSKPDAFVFKEKILTSSVASADVNDDGMQDMLIAERIRGEVYGKSTRLFYFQNNGDNQFEQKVVLDDLNIGMITDIATADLNGDGRIEIVVSGEWMGIEIYHIEDDQFVNVSATFGTENFSGLWRDIEVKDIDQDGDLDLIIANQGLNSFLNKRSKLYISDFDKNGKAEQINTIEKEGRDFPILDYDEITTQLPYLRSVVQTYADYGQASMEDLFSPQQMAAAEVRKLHELRSGMLVNQNGRFEFQPFPEVVQYSSIHVVEIDDVNQDGIYDIIVGGNHYLYKPQFGRDDASRGSVLLGELDGANYKIKEVNSLNISGEIRTIEKCGENEYWIGVNGEDVIKYRIEYEE